MEHKEGYLEFVSSESYKNQIDIWYRTYNISHEKIQLFYDFLVSLFNLIEETYLGSDILKYELDMKNHFTWCWEQTIASFDKEKIFFKEKGSCYEYFWNFFLEAYYIPQYLEETIRIKEYFYKLFDFNYKKSRSELDMLTEIYKKFEQNLKK
jgi:hypothetical protein